VFGQFSQLNNFCNKKFYPPDKPNPTIRLPTSAFFLAETHVHSEFWTVASELESLIKNLSDKFDGWLTNNLDKLKSHLGKWKKHEKQHHSRHHHRHHFKNDNELEKYLIEPDCMSRGRTLLSTRPAAGGTLSGELVSHQTGPMGTKHSTGIPDRFHGTESQPTLPHYSSEQTTLIQEEISKLLQKQAIQPVEYALERNFYSNIFLVPKKDGAKTCHQPQSSRQFCPPRVLQDKEGIHTLNETGRLAKKIRPEGCVLCDPNTPITSEISTISVPAEGLPLHLSPLWPHGCLQRLWSQPWLYCIRGESS